MFEGRTVERTGRARYFKSRIRHIGDAEEDDLRAVIADAPGVVLGVPRTLTMSKNGEAAFTAIVTRLDGNSDALELTLEAAAEGLDTGTRPVDGAGFLHPRRREASRRQPPRPVTSCSWAG